MSDAVVSGNVPTREQQALGYLVGNLGSHHPMTEAARAVLEGPWEYRVRYFRGRRHKSLPVHAESGAATWWHGDRVLEYYERAVSEGGWGKVWIERRPSNSEWQPVPVDVVARDRSTLSTREEA